jgi:hypothetical protein
MSRHACCCFLVGVLALSGLVGARKYSPPPPASDLVDAVLSSEGAAGNALATENTATAVTHKELLGRIVDASENISNTVGPRALF